MTAKAIFVLMVLYWGTDGRSSMTTAEFIGRDACVAAQADLSKEMNGWVGKTYSACSAKELPN